MKKFELKAVEEYGMVNRFVASNGEMDVNPDYYSRDMSWREASFRKAEQTVLILNELVDKINQANKLIAAVKAGYHGESYCDDVDGANWFDVAEEFLKENK